MWAYWGHVRHRKTLWGQKISIHEVASRTKCDRSNKFSWSTGSNTVLASNRARRLSWAEPCQSSNWCVREVEAKASQLDGIFWSQIDMVVAVYSLPGIGRREIKRTNSQDLCGEKWKIRLNSLLVIVLQGRYMAVGRREMGVVESWQLHVGCRGSWHRMRPGSYIGWSLKDNFLGLISVSNRD